MPDPKLLTEALVILLAPALPALAAAGEKAAGKAVVSDKVEEIWDRLRGKVEEKEAAKEAAEDLAQMPADEDRRASFRRQLVKILTADPGLTALLEPLVNAAGDGNPITIDPAAGPLPAEEVLRWLEGGFDVFLSHNSKDKPAVHELDTVVLDRDLPEQGLRRGDLGAVVQVYEPDGLEVEFVTAAGRTQALVTLRQSDVRAVSLAQGSIVSMWGFDLPRGTIRRSSVRSVAPFASAIPSK